MLIMTKTFHLNIDPKCNKCNDECTAFGQACNYCEILNNFEIYCEKMVNLYQSVVNIMTLSKKRSCSVINVLAKRDCLVFDVESIKNKPKLKFSNTHVFA